MATVRLAPDFFKKERNQAYTDWQSAFWRELFQNAVDQNASRINITIHPVESDVIITFNDNGPGMTRDVLENVYFAIGATTKSGPTQIGGMGRARILTCFAMKHYSIRSHNYLVQGKNGEYSIYDQSNFLSGCNLTITVDDSTVDRMTEKLSDFLGESRMNTAVYVNNELVNKSAIFQGRHVRDLNTSVDNSGENFAKVYVNKSADNHRVIIRVNGVSMFSERIEAKAQVVIELDPGLSRSILTSNRDELRGEYRGALHRFLQQLAVDTKSAIRDRFTRRTQVTSGGGMKRMRHPNRSLTWTDVTARQFATAVTEAKRESFTQNEVIHNNYYMNPFSVWMSMTFGDIYIYDETQNASMHKIIPNYLPENWVPMTVQGKTFRKGGNMLKVLLMWKTAITYALEVSFDYLDSSEISYAVGFIFKDSLVTGAAEHRIQNGGHVMTICPIDKDGKLYYSVRNRWSLKKLMTNAKHEVTHIKHSWHNESFSELRETIDERFDETECLRRMKSALDSMPDFETVENRRVA